MTHLGKRKLAEFEQGQTNDANPTSQFGIGQTLSSLKNSTSPVVQHNGAQKRETSDAENTPETDEGWEVASGKKRKRRKSKAAKEEKNSYPELTHSPHARLQTQVRIGDLQGLVLYLLADGPAPQWIAVKHHNAVGKVVVVMVPGLERDMFFGDLLKDAAEDEKKKDNGTGGSTHNTTTRGKPVSPDDYYPLPLDSRYLPTELQPMADMFRHLWPVKTPGDDKQNRMHSPLQAMLVAPLPKSQEEKQLKGVRPPREGKYWEDQPTPASKFVATTEELKEAEYILHPSLFTIEAEQEAEVTRREAIGRSTDDGWLDSKIGRQEAESKSDHKTTKTNDTPRVIAVDCEMCMVEGDVFALTRISVVDWDGKVLMDELVKPDKPITNYLTQYSGMTMEKLAPITTTLKDIQDRLLVLLEPDTILIGHSLNSDLDALKLTHPYVIDTSILYPHPRGPPLKSSLKWLAQKYLSRDVQAGANGHDSIEDARTALDLVKLKCQRGPKWGTPDSSSENIFKRIGRAPKPQGVATVTTSTRTDHCTTAIVDWGFPKRGYGAAADVCIGCQNDAEIVAGVKRSILGDPDGSTVPGGGVDFVWARMRELEAVRGWWNASKTADNDALRENITSSSPADGPELTNGHEKQNGTSLSSTVSLTISRLKDIYASLPPCTAFIVYSGSGDPREYTRLSTIQQQNKREYSTKKWDDVVKWGEQEERSLRDACRRAREGVGFAAVK